MPIKDRIKYFRLSLNLSQDDLHNLTGISQAQISKFEKGAVLPSLESILALAKVLKVNPIELLQDECGLTDEEVKTRLDHAPSKHRAIKESDQLMEAAVHLNTTIKELGVSLSAKEIVALDSMLELCRETLHKEVKKDTESQSAKTA